MKTTNAPSLQVESNQKTLTVDIPKNDCHFNGKCPISRFVAFGLVISQFSRCYPEFGGPIATVDTKLRK